MSANDDGVVDETTGDLTDDDDDGDDQSSLTEEQQLAAFESLNVLRSIKSPAEYARAWADASDEDRAAWMESGERGPLNDEGDDQPHIGEGHPGYESAMRSAEQTNLRVLGKVFSGTLRTDGETYERIADLADEINQLVGDERDAAVQLLARVLSRLELAATGAPSFGEVVSRESMIGADGRHRTILTDSRGQRRVIVTSREETEKATAEIRDAAAKGGPDPMAERSAEYVEAMAQLERNELKVGTFAKLAYKDRLAVLNAMTPEQTAEFEAAVGTTGME